MRSDVDEVTPRPSLPLQRTQTRIIGSAFLLATALAACATNSSSSLTATKLWDEPQPQCYLADAIAAGQRGQAQSITNGNESLAGGHGSIDRGEVERVIQSHLEEVRHCYRNGLKVDSSLAGEVVVRFTVGKGGHVLASTVTESSVTDLDMQACVGRAVCRWMFEAPPGSVVAVTYPFQFQRTLAHR